MVGGDWRFSKAAVQQWLATGNPTWETRKAAILELAGKYKDDPDLEQIVEEAMRRRGRPLMEDGTYSGCALNSNPSKSEMPAHSGVGG